MFSKQLHYSLIMTSHIVKLGDKKLDLHAQDCIHVILEEHVVTYLLVLEAVLK